MVEDFLAALDFGSVDNGGYQDGRVVDLRPVAAKRALYLVGDLHAKFERIDAILEHGGLRESLREEAVLVFLGDLFHREDERHAGEMESSLQTLRAIMKLKIRFPQSVYMLLGNHEFTSTQSTKRGYFQGQLFRQALEAEGLFDTYQQFLQVSPLVVIHPRVVGVHAGPALSVSSLEDLKALPVHDVAPAEMHPAVLQLAFSRHRDWSPDPAKAFNDHHIEDFLSLCQVPTARLITGHTPLDRQTAWNWDIGRHLTVIFAAGRELGYLRVDHDSEQLVRVGRSLPDDDQQIVLDRGPTEHHFGTIEFEKGRRHVRLDDLITALELSADVIYKFDYPGMTINLSTPSGHLRVSQYRHLPAGAQAYYNQGYYLIGNERRGEILKLKRHLSVLLGGADLVEGVRFSWGSQEVGVLRQEDDGVFVLQPLIAGLTICASQ